MERRSTYSYCLILLLALMLPASAELIGGSKVVNINKLTPKGADGYVLTMNGTTTQWLPASASGSGDVSGPSSATDNAVVRFDSTTGKLIQNSAATIDNSGILTAAGTLLSGLTASEIVITDGSKNLSSAAVATYPSLTELAYVKGVTSAIQTQLSSKLNDTTDTFTGTLTLDGNGAFNRSAYFDAIVDDGDTGAAETIDWRSGNKHKSTLTGNVTYTFTDPAGPTSLQLFMFQDGTGSRTATWPSGVEWPGGTACTLTTTANAMDIVTLVFNGSAGAYYAQCANDFQ